MHGGGFFRRAVEAPEEQVKDRTRVLKRLLGLLMPYRSWLVLILFLVVVSSTSQGLSPYLIGRAVDDFISAGNREGLAHTILLLIGVYLAGAVATRFQIYLIARMGQTILADLRQRVFDKIMGLSLQYLESKQAGEIMSRLVNDIDALNNFFSQALTQMIGQFFAMLGIAVAMLSVNIFLGVTVLIMVPLLFWVTKLFSRWARQSFRRTRETLGDVSADLEEELGGVKVAQAFNRTDENIRRFEQSNAANRDANVSANAITSAFSPALDVLSTLDMALVAVMGGALVVAGRISVGVVVAFLQYVQNFFRPIQAFAQLWTMAQAALAAAERVFEVLDVSATIQDADDVVDIEDFKGRVDFVGVRFAYDSDEPVLEDVTFTALPGQLIAVVGPTGAGKTTLVNLIPRFYDVCSGSVLIDGVDVRRLRQQELRAQIGLVAQEPFLFSGTIIENIHYGRLDATDDEVIAVAKAANVDQFVANLPGGYQANVGERGKLLSQGQRQLIAIARALLANPRILIMDEATANIDIRTEVLIQRALKQLLLGRTSFVVAHRLSTIRSADVVLVLDDGRIVERGTHQELVERGGLYADLYRRQFYRPTDY